MAKWIVKAPVFERARNELALLFENPDIRREIIRVLNLLADLEHPGKPENLWD
jgi:hypothetical protein